MNKPTQTTGSNQVIPTDYHKKASFVDTLKSVASIPYYAVRNTFRDPYAASLKKQGYGKK